MKTPAHIDFSQRQGLYGVNGQFIQRWSPRYFQRATLSDDVVCRMLEAARWSPSCYNEQPWHFYISDEQSFDDYLQLLVEGNQAWAKDTSAIGFLVARRQFEKNGKENDFAAFDCGSAWMALCLQANHDGWYVHGMGGIEKEAIYQAFNIDKATHQVVMGFAIGKLGNLAEADDETREKEKPNSRKPLNDIFTRGK